MAKTTEEMKSETMFMSPETEQEVLAAKGRLVKDDLYALISEYDGMVYAYHCKACGGTWKIYQSRYHHPECPRRK